MSKKITKWLNVDELRAVKTFLQRAVERRPEIGVKK